LHPFWPDLTVIQPVISAQTVKEQGANAEKQAKNRLLSQLGVKSQCWDNPHN